MSAPNVIVLCTDDIGFNEIGAYQYQGYPDRDRFNGEKVHTPNLDSLAQEGVLLSRFYATSPISSPSRYSILTGRYASRSPGITKKYPPPTQPCIGWGTPISREEGNLGSVFKNLGYATGYVGKWHNGQPKVDQPDFDDGISPQDPEFARAAAKAYETQVNHLQEGFGFDYAERVYFGNREAFPKPLQVHNLEWLAEGALDFINDNKETPFFLYFATSTPHGDYDPLAFNPLLTPRGVLEKKPDVMPPREGIAGRLEALGLSKNTAMATWQDDCFGAILNRLKELNLSENTIVLYTNDHLARGKYMCYEGARVPCLVRWPAGIPGGRKLEKVCSNIDLVATLTELAGATLPSGYQTDGRSFAPLLTEPDTAHAWREQLLLEVSNIRAIVTDRWKYIASRASDEICKALEEDKQEALAAGRNRYVGWDGRRNPHHYYEAEGVRYFMAGRFENYFDPDQLYDLQADVFERTNLASDPMLSETLAALKAALTSELEKLPHDFGEFSN